MTKVFKEICPHVVRARRQFVQFVLEDKFVCMLFAFEFVLEDKFVRMLFAFEFVLEDKFVRMLFFAFEFVLEDKFVRMLLVPLEGRMFSALSFRPSVCPHVVCF